ncbi:MAG: hypothetical protein QOK40_303, partial [Miltoncostaeaceae bacterium]|nr:hypothetical protein [Miltoncostaeaceae bacterium]
MTLHPLLERQLRQLGAASDAPPTADEWRAFLERVNRSYEASDRDRYLVERSLEISSTEMAELNEQLRRSSESELAAERDKLRTVIESVGDGLCVLDAEGTILFANPEARRLLAAPESDLSGRRLRDVVRIRQDGQDGERILGEVWRDASTPRRHDDAVFDTTDGRSFPASYVLNPF